METEQGKKPRLSGCVNPLGCMPSGIRAVEIGNRMAASVSTAGIILSIHPSFLHRQSRTGPYFKHCDERGGWLCGQRLVRGPALESDRKWMTEYWLAFHRWHSPLSTPSFFPFEPPVLQIMSLPPIWGIFLLLLLLLLSRFSCVRLCGTP